MTQYNRGREFEYVVRNHFHAEGKLPTPTGRAPYCACGCGHRTSTKNVRFIKGHRPPLPLKVRIWRNVAVDANGCWLWTRGLNRNGYASMTIDGHHQLVHRVSYETFCGPIPDGLTIDHLCSVRHCANPEHLEPVTLAENVRRAGALEASIFARQNKPFCPQGHPRNSENTATDKAGKKFCRVCARERSLALYHRKKAG